MNLKGEVMSKSVERVRQRTWAHTQWRPSVWFCVAGPVAMISMLISEFREFLLRIGLCSDIVLGFG